MQSFMIIFLNIYIVTCVDLLVISNAEVTYTPPHSISAGLPEGKRYVGTIATYSCLSGYQLEGGSSLRACGADGEWNGTALSCGKYTVCGPYIATLRYRI